MNAKTTKRALFSSVLAIVLCLAMLIGTTFAWFTDTASTGVNKIQAGNLALKYTIGLNSQVGFTNGKNVDGETYNIGDYLKMGTANMSGKTAFANREAAWTAVSGNADAIKNLKPFVEGMPTLEARKTTDPIALVIYMPTEIGNEANAGSKASYVARLGVDVYATQATVENDSFDNTYDEKAPTVFKAESASSGTHEITTNMQANGRYGAVQAERSAQFTINADVYAVYTTGAGVGAAMAVQAGGDSKVVINGGDFRQVGVPASDPICDLIYALGNATIEINGGTFKAVTPERTLSCQDGSKAKITVSGGSFYKYDPSNHALGDNEVVVAAGYHVEHNGDWFVVTKN